MHAELMAGRKATHWMWFVFPQLAGLGFSRNAQFYAISSLEEASAYLAHQTLGSWLVECSSLVNAVEGRNANDIFRSPDDRKFQSSMTLFAMAEPGEPAFGMALQKYFGGSRDRRTLSLLGSQG